MVRNRTVLAGMAALVAAMLGLMGFVDWLAVIETTFYVVVGLTVVLGLLAIVGGLPIVLFVSLVEILVKPFTETGPSPNAQVDTQ